MSETTHTPTPWEVKECADGMLVVGRPQDGNPDWDYGGYGIVCTVNYESSQLTAEELLASHRESLTRDVKYHDDRWAKVYMTLLLEMLDSSEVPA